MSAAASTPVPEPREREPEKHYNLSLDETLELDVRFCDLVAGRDHGSPYQVRFRGTRAGTHEGLRLYFDLEDVEGPMLHERILAAAVERPSRVDSATRVELRLEKWALTFRKYRVGGGRMKVEVRPRGAPATALFTRALEEAADQVVPALTARGYAVGTEDVITIARDLMRARSHQG